jgi:hypothetical protein
MDPSFATIVHTAVVRAAIRLKIWLSSQAIKRFAQPASDVGIASAK